MKKPVFAAGASVRQTPLQRIIQRTGRRPTECRLSHHSIRLDNFKRSKSISWAVVQEWLNPDNADVVAEVIRRYEEETSTE